MIYLPQRDVISLLWGNVIHLPRRDVIHLPWGDVVCPSPSASIPGVC